MEDYEKQKARPGLEAIVRAYIQRHRPRAQAEFDWFRQQPTLKAAIECAALARDSKGDKYKHQHRLKKMTLEEARKALLNNYGVIEKSKDFEELFAWMQKILEPILGLGPLYLYDTALRIGAKLDIWPAKVYLHAGTRCGAKELGLDGKAKILEKSLMPAEFGELGAHEIEDVLCIYKDRLKAAIEGRPLSGIDELSGCNYRVAGDCQG